MAPRRIELPPPADKADPEIKDLLLIKADLDVPTEGEFTGYVREKDLADFNKNNRKIFLAMSVLEQWADWQTEKLALAWAHIRQLDANAAKQQLELIKARAERAEREITERIERERIEAEKKKSEKRKAWFRWLGMTISAALIGAGAKTLIEWLAK